MTDRKISFWPRPVFATTVLVGFLVLLCCQITLNQAAAATANETTKSVRGHVVDANGQPIPNAWLIQRFTDLYIPESPLEIQTDELGRFDINIPEFHNDDASIPLPADQVGFFVFAPGYMVRSLYGSYVLNREIEIVMTPQQPKEVELVNENGDPIAGAKVTPWNGNIGLGLAMQSRLESITDQNGKAQLANFDENLSSIQATLTDGERYLFVLPDSSTSPQSTIRCMVKRFQSTIRVTVLDADNQPIGLTTGSEALIFASTSEEEINPLLVRTPTSCTQAFGKTDKSGTFSFQATSPERVTLSVRIPGITETIREVKPIRGKTVNEIIRAPQRFPTAITVMRIGTGEPAVGIRVAFTRGRTYWNSSTTNEDGIAQFDLEAGPWECTIDEMFPDGLVFGGKPSKFTVLDRPPHGQEMQFFPPLIVESCKTLHGHIEGINFKQQLINWCGVSHTDVVGNERFFSGIVDNDGNFNISIPPSVDVKSLERFQLSHNDRNAILKVVSYEPLILKYEPPASR